MIEHYYSRQFDLLRLRRGPLGPHIDKFAGNLTEKGYCELSVRRKLRLVAALNRWLSAKALKLRQLNEGLSRAFLKAQWKRVLRLSGDEATLKLLLRHLREAEVIPPLPIPSVKTGKEILGKAYERFLFQERGFAPATVPVYLGIANRFLSQRFSSGTVRLSTISPKDIVEFILGEARTNGRKWVQLTATVLRSFLGFLYQHGKVAINLAAAVPAVPVWRLSELPRFLESEAVEKLLKCSDQGGEHGSRDYAVLLLLARLGLRASEIVNLNLEDLNWESSELLVKGKGGRIDRLPLMRDAGQALANYLQNWRPKCSVRSVFIRLKAPRRGFSSSAGVDFIVAQALTRANLHPANRGAHVLRHSLATRMLRSGASLTEIGEVLRHQQCQTTEIYAKVDFASLRALAQPWPGGVR
jgi:site-specific recombinase XerD